VLSTGTMFYNEVLSNPRCEQTYIEINTQYIYNPSVNSSVCSESGHSIRHSHCDAFIMYIKS